MNYTEFLESKAVVAPSVGFDVSDADLNPCLFPFQRDLVKWSIRKGRAALFATTGMGKTAMQLAWAEAIARRSIVFAPLAVATQTVEEAARFGFNATYARSMDASPTLGITVANYEMLEHFDLSQFGAVVLDESSCLKDFESKRKKMLVDRCSVIPLRLCCSATPAPNDIAELANHAEFLGIMTRTEMLATFFVHDEDGWRLKGHAREGFYKWLASWGMSLLKPSDIGHSDDGYVLPPLQIEPVIVQVDKKPDGYLFASTLKGITERASVRKDTVDSRVAKAAELIQSDPSEQWLVWCGLNDEAEKLTREVELAVNVKGSDSFEDKTSALTGFARGDLRVLITKPKIAGMGMNLQRCARMVFLGLSDSYEQYFQSIRRCWRFGQKRPVHVYIVLTNLEEEIYYNVLRKEKEAQAMSAELIAHVAEFEKAEIGSVTKKMEYKAHRHMEVPGWLKVQIAICQ